LFTAGSADVVCEDECAKEVCGKGYMASRHHVFSGVMTLRVSKGVATLLLSLSHFYPYLMPLKIYDEISKAPRAYVDIEDIGHMDPTHGGDRHELQVRKHLAVVFVPSMSCT
jgi:hypothetical protein